MSKFARSLFSALVFLGTLFFVSNVQGQAGKLDSTFGSGGKVETSFGGYIDAIPSDAALLSDGRLLVVGTFDNIPNIATGAFGVVRYLPNGKLDSTFGNGGVVFTAFTNFISNAYDMTLQPDGKILVVGDTEAADGSFQQWALARYNHDGSLDSIFGQGGKVTTEFFGPPPHFGGVRETANVVLLQPDGKILLGGLAQQFAKRPMFTALARYNINGTLDTTFGTAGRVLVKLFGQVNALALKSDGGILAWSDQGAVAQFSAHGQLDPAVTAGVVVVTAKGADSALQSDGKFLLGGGIGSGGYSRDFDVKVVRFQATGGADPTFQSAVFDFGNENRFPDLAQALEVEQSGRILVGGISQPDINSQIFGLARLNPGGSLDTSFGNGGRLTTAFQGSDQVTSIVIQTDGKIIAVGQTLNRTTGRANLALARYLGH